MKTNTVVMDNKTVNLDKVKLGTEHVSLYYGGFQALRDITLDIPEKAITAVIGPWASTALAPASARCRPMPVHTKSNDWCLYLPA